MRTARTQYTQPDRTLVASRWVLEPTRNPSGQNAAPSIRATAAPVMVVIPLFQRSLGLPARSAGSALRIVPREAELRKLAESS